MMERRTALGLLAGATGLAALAPDARAADARGVSGGHGFDPANPEHRALAFRKLAWSMDETLTFQWLHGTRYGIQGSLLTPFWEMHVATWFRTRDLGEGRYEVRSAGANFYTLPGEGQLLEQFHNPYTGQTVDIPYAPPRPTKSVYDSSGGTTFGEVPGMKTTRSTGIGPVWVQGDELSVRGDLSMHMEPTDPAKHAFTVQDMSTWIGLVADVMNPKARNPAARHLFNDVLDYPPYLKMGDQPGTYFSRCHGRKVHGYADMPATWRTLFEQKFPEVARDPGAILERG